MASAERHHQRNQSLLSKFLAVGPPSNNEELDANDLEVAMINESFEEQMKHSLLFTNPDLKSVFYGAPDWETATKLPSGKQSPDLGIEEEGADFKMEVSPPPLIFLPNITPPSDKDELDRGQQLNKELERMMLEAESPLVADSPLMMASRLLDVVVPICDASLPIFLPDEATFMFGASFSSQLESDGQQDACECADAAEKIAYDVISSLFADEHQYSTVDSFSDEDEGEEEIMVINANILQLLQEDEIESDTENALSDNDDDSKKLDKSEKEGKYVGKDLCKLPPPTPYNNSMQTSISSPTSADEQTVPVIDSWEQLGDSPIAAEKVYSEAKAVLKKIRAERKATQL